MSLKFDLITTNNFYSQDIVVSKWTDIGKKLLTDYSKDLDKLIADSMSDSSNIDTKDTIESFSLIQ